MRIQELAYLGDAVFELRLREMLVNSSNGSLMDLNRRAQSYACATAQAFMYHCIFDRLTDEETSVIKRGRNTHSGSKASSASVTEYRHATGLEALFGWLYVSGQKDRIQQIFDWCIEAANTQGASLNHE